MALEETQPFETGLVSRLKRAFTRHTLWWAIGFSVLLHAVLIAWRFADPVSFNRVFEDTSLEVVLVNARSDSLPERAQAIAQVRLSGGGQSPGLQRATTPLPPSAVNESGTDIGAMQRQIEALEERRAVIRQHDVDVDQSVARFWQQARHAQLPRRGHHLRPCPCRHAAALVQHPVHGGDADTGQRGNFDKARAFLAAGRSIHACVPGDGGGVMQRWPHALWRDAANPFFNVTDKPAADALAAYPR